jgi:hypothetical protein
MAHTIENEGVVPRPYPCGKRAMIIGCLPPADRREFARVNLRFNQHNAAVKIERQGIERNGQA